MPTASVPRIVDLYVPGAMNLVNGTFVLKIAHPGAQGGTQVAVSDPARAPQNVRITHQSPLNGEHLDVGGTVTAILAGVTV